MLQKYDFLVDPFVVTNQANYLQTTRELTTKVS